jgi:hypothetical protein
MNKRFALIMLVLAAGACAAVYLNGRKDGTEQGQGANQPLENSALQEETNAHTVSGDTVQPVSVYDMKDVANDTNPCSGEVSTLDSGIQDNIKKFYADLSGGKYAEAAAILNDPDEDNNIFGYLYPVCSSYHKSLAAAPKKGGVAVFTASGNGLPGVPNDTYSFGYITASADQINLYEETIKSYFSEAEVAAYDGAKEADEEHEGLGKAQDLLEELESKNAKSFLSGSFGSSATQKEYEDYYSRF